MSRTDLTGVPYDDAFVEGARNAVRTCLAVRRGERAVLITDEACKAIGAALDAQFREAGADLATFVLEDEAPRPLQRFPAPVAEAMESAAVSCFAATVVATGQCQLARRWSLASRGRLLRAARIARAAVTFGFGWLTGLSTALVT